MRQVGEVEILFNQLVNRLLEGRHSVVVRKFGYGQMAFGRSLHELPSAVTLHDEMRIGDCLAVASAMGGGSDDLLQKQVAALVVGDVVVGRCQFAGGLICFRIVASYR